MTTREWLNRGFALSRRLEIKKATRDTLANVISHYSTDEAKTDHTRNTSEDTMIRWSETQREIERLELELRIIDKETEQVIKQLQNSNEYVVLYCRYIKRLSWKEVQKAVTFSSQHVFKLHADGVRNCATYMDSIKTFWG